MSCNPTSSDADLSDLLRGQLTVLLAALMMSIAAVWWSWTHRAFLLYGDAEAHIHIARRLFDSHRPGLAQLGSVWLPLPHLLLVPFLAVDTWWRNGFAPVIPSEACYVLGCIGIYRLARKWLSPVAASVGVAFFATNPNLLYLQTTAMTEPLFLCELIWTVLLLVEWHASLDVSVERDPHQTHLLWIVVAVLVAAVYTRYDGWILAFAGWIAMASSLLKRGKLVRTQFVAASVVLLLAPVGWMVYNAAVFGDWLDFMRGPYSAKAIELRTAVTAVDPHPGWHNPWVSAIYFNKAAKMDAAAIGFGNLLFVLALAGTVLAFFRPILSGGNVRNRTRGSEVAWTLFLWMPLPFYAYSVSFGSVPIFLPIWRPFAWYNTRYGMELLPAFALFLAFAFSLVWSIVSESRPRFRWLTLGLVYAAIAGNAVEIMREGPLTYVEGKKNNESRGYYNQAIPAVLRQLHEIDPAGIVLMDTASFPSIVPHAGLTYRQTLNESDKQFYNAALAAPGDHASIVLAFAGDEVDQAIKAHPEHLRRYDGFRSNYQPDATIYVSDTLAERIAGAGDSIGKGKKTAK